MFLLKLLKICPLGASLVSDDIRSQIQRSEEGAIRGLYGVNYHDLDEFGVGQEYQLYYTGTLVAP